MGQYWMEAKVGLYHLLKGTWLRLCWFQPYNSIWGNRRLPMQWIAIPKLFQWWILYLLQFIQYLVVFFMFMYSSFWRLHNALRLRRSQVRWCNNRVQQKWHFWCPNANSETTFISPIQRPQKLGEQEKVNMGLTWLIAPGTVCQVHHAKQILPCGLG